LLTHAHSVFSDKRSEFYHAACSMSAGLGAASLRCLAN
jgi:hypothetical protein